MRGSLLALNHEIREKVEQHISDNSSPCPLPIVQQWKWSNQHRADADKMCSLAQLSWLRNVAFDRKARRILDVGCFTGLSAMTWFEGTRETEAEILTIEADNELIDVASKVFLENGYDARIKILPGLAADILPHLTGTFDIVFVDIAFEAYKDTVDTILNHKLLAPTGVILVDNVFARGFVVDDDIADVDQIALMHWRRAGALMREFNQHIRDDPRVTVSIVPIFDGVSDIRWRHASKA